MKNCELFTTEDTLKAAWRKRQEILGNGNDDSGFVEWACFSSPDYALLPQYAPGKLLWHNEHYVISKGPVNKGDAMPLDYLMYLDTDGRVYHDEARDTRFKPVQIPDDIMNLARAQVLEELKTACPLVRCSHKKGKDKHDS